MTHTFLGPGEGERLAVGPASTVVIKATGDDTGGRLCLSEVTVEPGFPGPPPHTHRHMHDMFYVLEGELTVLLDGAETVAGPGAFVCAPPGTVHTFVNASDAPVRFLNFNAPGGWEHYMRALADAAAQPGGLTPDTVGALATDHDVQVAPPTS